MWLVIHRRNCRRRPLRGLAVIVSVLVLAAACSDTDAAVSETRQTAVSVSSTIEMIESAKTTEDAETTEVPDSNLVRPEGFERVAGTITGADGTVCDVCLWLATTGDQRNRGLMGVTDVGDGDGTADGMAFVYPRPHTGSFWMKNTLLPLSIAFFAESGEYLSSFDMEPCTADPCPSYPTPAEFLVAIEVPQGNLPDLAIAEGSTLDLTDLPCDR